MNDVVPIALRLYLLEALPTDKFFSTIGMLSAFAISDIIQQCVKRLFPVSRSAIIVCRLLLGCFITMLM